MAYTEDLKSSEDKPHEGSSPSSGTKKGNQVKKEEISIALGIPHNGDVTFAYANSLVGLCLYEASKDKEDRLLGSVLQSQGCYVDDNREVICLDLINKTKDTHVMMIDPDIQFQPTILEKFYAHLEANPEANIIAGRVNLLNGLPVFYKVDREKQCNIHQPFPFEGLKEFDLVGTGIIIISKKALIDIYEKEGHQHWFHRIITGDNVRLGDDFSFCARAWKHGYKIYGAWDVVGIHHKTYPAPQRYLEANELVIRTK